MTPDQLKNRTKHFSLRVIRLVDALPKRKTAMVIGMQLLRCATSVGANYRAACRAQSKADFAAKMSIVETEADESVFWLELLVEAGVLKDTLVTALIAEANELTASRSSIPQNSQNSRLQNRKSTALNRQSTIHNHQSTIANHHGSGTWCSARTFTFPEV